MKTSSLMLIVLAVFLTLSLVSIWFFPSVHDFMTGNAMWNGIRSFSAETKVVAKDTLTDLPSVNKGVLLSIPYTDYSREDLDRMKQFISQGNTLVLMDDFGYGNTVLEYLGVPARFAHDPLLDPLFCYKNPYFPHITDFSTPVQAAGIHAVVFNHGTFLDSVDNSAALAWSSPQSFSDNNGNGIQEEGEAVGPLVVAAEYEIGKGRLGIVSDPSLVINIMVNQNDNYRFVQYLTRNNGPAGDIFLDRSHLSTTPLDTSKISLESIRNVISHPYALLLLVAVIFILVTCFTLKKGELVG